MKFPLKSVKLRRKDELGSVHPSPENFENTAYWPGFFSAKQLGVFLLPPGWDNSPIPIYTLCGERHCDSKVSFRRTQRNAPAQCLKADRFIWTRAH